MMDRIRIRCIVDDSIGGCKARGMACVQDIIIVLGSQRGDERASQELMC